MNACLTAICKPIRTRGTGQVWLFHTGCSDQTWNLHFLKKVNCCFLQLCSFWGVSGTYSGSRKVIPFLLKLFSSESCSRGVGFNLKRKPTRRHKATTLLTATSSAMFAHLSLCTVHGQGWVQGWGKEAKDAWSLSRLNGKFNWGSQQWSQLFRTTSQPSSAMLKSRHPSQLGITQHGNATGQGQQTWQIWEAKRIYITRTKIHER